MSSEPMNDWEITSIHFAALPVLAGSVVKAQFVESPDAAREQPTLIPSADAEADGIRPERLVKDDYYGP